MSDAIIPGMTPESEMERVAATPETTNLQEWGTLESRIAAETESRPGRVEQLMASAQALFSPESWEKVGPLIRRQLDTPQWGNETETKKAYHHHEGIFMDRHLGGILDAIDATAAGQIPRELHEADRAWLQVLASTNKELLGRYAFLHDLSKPDTLRMTSLGADGQQVVTEYTWDEWQAQLPESLRTGTEPVSPQVMADYLQAQRIIQVSYFQQGKERGEGKQHGNVGADRVAELDLSDTDVPSYILQAIRKHEVAYQFSSIKVDTFQKHFVDFSDQEIRFALVATYLDQMGSKGSDGRTDPTAVRTLFDSAHNYTVIRDAETIVRIDFTGDPKKLDAHLVELRKGTTRLEAPVNTLAAQLREKSRPTVYNVGRLRELLKTQVEAGTLTVKQSQVIQQAVSDQKVGELGRVLGKAMQVVKPLLVQAEQQ